MYNINNLYEFETIDEVDNFLRENIGVWQDNNEFDNFLDEIYSGYTIFNTTYSPSRILYSVDKDTYDIVYNEWLTNMIDDYMTLLERDGSVTINDYVITEHS